MFNWIRWKFNTALERIQKFVKAPGAWECYFCHHVFDGIAPRVNAYKDGKPIYQCEPCRIRLDMETTPTDPKLFDSDG